MRMDAIDVGRGLHRHDACLAEAANAVGRTVPPQVVRERTPCRAVSRQASRPAHGDRDAARLAVQVFGKIGDRRGDFVMDGMARGVGRVAQRDDAEVDPPTLEAEDLLRDEGF
jgi:hypothetical protein